MKFQSQADLFPPIPVHKSTEDKVVPDMSFTPREIIGKFSRGEKVPLGFEGQYDCEDYPENDRYLDHFEADPDLKYEEPLTRDPSFDFGDYVEANNDLKEREVERKKRAAERKRRSNGQSSTDPKRKASDEEPSASEAMKRETTSGGAVEAPSAQPKK